MSEVARLRIEGRVQGVWFRAWTVEEARRRGLTGWVRNRTDGSVEALFSGESEAVAGMVDACHIGSSAARVTAVERLAVADAEPAGKTFEQRPTK